MGQLIATVVGGVFGFLIGGPLGASIGMSLGGMIGASLFGPTISGPRLNDLKVAASTYGAAIPEIYGTARIGGNMIWTTGINEVAKTEGGKGGPKYTTYLYDATFAMAVCKGPIDKVLRIWADSKLIYDDATMGGRTPISGTNKAPSVWSQLALSIVGVVARGKLRMRVHLGTEDQLPDSLIVADKGIENTSAHRGLCYVVFEKLALEDFGNRIPQLSFEVTKSQSDSFPNVSATEDGSVLIPNAQNKLWYPDWEANKLYGLDSTTGSGSLSYALDMATMQIMYTGQNIWPGGNKSYAFIGNTMLKRAGSNNCAPVDFWNLAGFNKFGSIGVSSNSVSGYYNAVNKELAVPNFGKMITARCTTALGRQYNICTISLSRYCWIFTPTGIPYENFRTPWIPTEMMEGRTDTALSQFIGWRYATGSLQLMLLGVAGSVEAEETINEAGQPVFVPTPVKSTYVNLRPFDEAFEPRVVLFDATDNHVFCLGLSAGTPTVIKYSIETGVYKFKVKHTGIRIPSVTNMGRMQYSRIAGGTFGWCYSQFQQQTRMFQIHLQTGAEIRDSIIGNALGNQNYLGGSQQWDDTSSSLIMETQDRIRRIYFRSGFTEVDVASIVRDICKKSGVLTDADIDTTDLSEGTLSGYAIDRQCTARDALKQLATAFLFDGYESDYKLKFRSRGDASQVTIPQSWVARNEGVAMRETITQELEMPLKISVNYYDISRDHQQGTQSAKRKANPFPTMWTNKEDVIDLPIYWMPDDAKQCADRMLKMTWANRTSYQFQLPWRYLKYDPTDIATVSMESGTTYSLRLGTFNIGADFSIEANGVSEKATAYVSNVIGSPGLAPPQSIPSPTTAFPIVINTPLLRDEDYTNAGAALCYVSAGTESLYFNGAYVFIDDGIEYRSIASIGKDTVSGKTVNALPKTLAYESTDETSILRVRLSDPGMELESVTQEDMLNLNANGALVGKEVIQFRNAVLQSNGEWWLSGLRRARRGTNYAVGSHVAGEVFIMLDPAGIGAFDRPPESYETTRNFKAATPGSVLAESPPYPVKLEPRDLMPYTPEDIKISDNGTTVTISARRRSRVMAVLASGTGNIHYKEGDKNSAKFTYQIWPGLSLTDVGTASTPGVTGNVFLFDALGEDTYPVVSFPLTDLSGQTKFLLRLTEFGEVDGIPKWVGFERLDQNRWNINELY